MTIHGFNRRRVEPDFLSSDIKGSTFLMSDCSLQLVFATRELEPEKQLNHIIHISI